MVEVDCCNLLVDPLPLTIPLGREELPIETNFRTGILFEMMINSPDLSDSEKVIQAIDLWFPNGFPDNPEQVQAAFDGMLWFYSCGATAMEKDRKISPAKESTAIEKRIFDYDIDAPLIYAAFLSQYRIDLQDIKYLHWWKFSAMFKGLTEGHEIVRIMGYRSVNLSQIKNKAERLHYAQLQAKYALPDNRSVEDKQKAAGALFGGSMFK